MPPLTKQERRVLDYIEANPGATTREIIHDTYITCPSGRISEMRAKGVPIISIGRKRYGKDTRAFEMYALKTPVPPLETANPL